MPVRFMHGNRDFLVAHAFAESTGIELIEDPTVLELYGRRTVLLHGDTLCTGDLEYQKLRAQVRNPFWQRAVLAKPIPERVKMAQALRGQSETAKGVKEMEIMDVAEDAVERAFEASGAELMIHGHTHRPGCHEYRAGGRVRVRWVLPDWYEAGGYLEVSPAGVRALAA